MEPLARRVRAHPRITGIRFGGDTHTVSLYADDVLLTVANPEVSLASALAELDSFGGVSGFKINVSKSTALNLSLPVGKLTTIQEQFPIRWSTDAIPYLGIRLAPTIPATHTINYSVLQSQVQSDLRRWRRHSISWLGRIAALKMVSLPKCLYLFQTLALEPPPGWLQRMQSEFSRFVWQDRRPRMRCLLSFLPPSEGGLGIPDLTLYFKAAQLRILAEWSRDESEKNWPFQDQAVAGRPLKSVPFLLKHHRPPALYTSPITRTTLRAWDQTNIRHGLTTFPSPLTPLFDNPEFPSGFHRAAYPGWRTTGCFPLGPLYGPSGVVPFHQLCRDYGIPATDTFQYLQLTHWASRTEIRTQADRRLTQFERWLITRTSDKKLISDLYKLLQLHYFHMYQPGRARWERDMGRAFTDREWEGICYRARHSATRIGLTETYTKLAYYWYYTPERLHHMDSTHSPDCWRGCGEQGSLLHLLWDCKYLTAYWTMILDDVDKHFNTEIPRLPEYVLLGVPNSLTYPLKSRRGKQMALALGAATQNILAHWKTPHQRWLHRLWHILGMEKLSLTLAGRGSSYGELWQPFLSLLAHDFRELTCPTYLRLLRLVP